MAKETEWITTDGDFFDDMLAKERKMLQELLTPEELAALDEEERKLAESDEA